MATSLEEPLLLFEDPSSSTTTCLNAHAPLAHESNDVVSQYSPTSVPCGDQGVVSLNSQTEIGQALLVSNLEVVMSASAQPAAGSDVVDQ